MRKIALVLVALGLVSVANAQEAADKKVQAGLVFSAGMNMIQPGTKFIAKNGLGSDLTVGMNLNFAFTPTIGVNTGIEFDFESIKYKAGSTSLYYYYNDTEVFRKAEYLDGEGNYSPKGSMYNLTSRKQKPIYLTIPTMMMFKTKFIGYFRYFGKFGIRNSFLLSNTYSDKGIAYTNENPMGISADNDGMKSSVRDLSLYKGAVGISGGAEWNFSGSTCLVAELGYYYGFVDVNRGKSLAGDDEKNMTVFTSRDLITLIPSGYSNLSFKQNQLLFKVSILF